MTKDQLESILAWRTQPNGPVGPELGEGDRLRWIEGFWPKDHLKRVGVRISNWQWASPVQLAEIFSKRKIMATQ